MALEPGLVRLDELALDPEPLLSLQIEHPDNYQHAEKIVDSKFVVPRMTQRPDIRVGVMGYPERASRETGERIVNASCATGRRGSWTWSPRPTAYTRKYRSRPNRSFLTS